MHNWTRAEKIGCGSMIGATMACLVALSTVPSLRGFLPRGFSEAPSQRPSEAVQTQSQIEALEQERTLARRLYEERIRARYQRIEAIAERYSHGNRREYDRIVVENRCPADVAVSLYYLDLDEKWITRGWWQVPPGQSMTTDAMTRHRYLYLYAENQRLGRIWDGAGTPDAVELSVSDSKFDHLKGDRFFYEDPRSVSFVRRDTGESWTDFKEVFECFAEAPR